MQVATTTMDPRVARIYYGDYMKKCKATREKRMALAEKDRLEGGKKYREARERLAAMEKEDRQLLSAYKALKKGQTILHVGQVVVNAGLNSKKLPKLAVARAMAEWCHIEESSGMHHRTVEFIGSSDKNSHWRAKTADKFKLPFKEGFTSDLTDFSWRNKYGYPRLRSVVCAVPSVPPHLRPDDFDKGGYHILWEAEWEEKAPVDPLLLKRVDTSDFFVVLAQWDATPLEQQVLQGRFS